MEVSCCQPANLNIRKERNFYLYSALNVSHASSALVKKIRDEMRYIPGGIYEMGSRRSRFPEDYDSPRVKVKVSPFLMSPVAVTNGAYLEFVEQTGYRTIAEIEGWSYVFYLLLAEPSRWSLFPVNLPWWRRVDGACWAAPEGPGSSISGREDHPVVHISWYDALAYCRWSGLKLPTEAEWERAARGGLVNNKFPWGNVLEPNNSLAMNIFPGDFPSCKVADGICVGTMSVKSFKPNGYGMFNMTGNVWEWVSDFFGSKNYSGKLPILDPEGPENGVDKVQRGGSYLCHSSYCDRYYVHSRTRNSPDSSTGNSGFRVAAMLRKK